MIVKSFKRYRNTLSEIWKRTREMYYKNKIDERVGDPKRLWT